MHQPRHELLQQLALAEDEHGLLADARADVVEALDRLAHPNQPDEQQRTAREQPARDREGGGERDRAGGDRYWALAFRSSAEIAGTISCRSPITA